MQLIGDLSLSSTGRFSNSGSLQTGGAIDLGFGIIQQYGSLASAGPMNLQARDLLALGGKTQSAQQMTLGAGRVLANGGSETCAQNTLRPLTPQLERQGTLGGWPSSAPARAPSQRSSASNNVPALARKGSPRSQATRAQNTPYSALLQVCY